jgi:hypothetical protein
MALLMGATTVITDADVAQNMTYTNVQPAPATDSAVTGTKTIDMSSNAMEIYTMTGATSFSLSNEAAGRTKVILLDTNTTGFAPTFSGVEYPEGGSAPTWSSYRYWQLYLVSWSATTTRLSAIGFST